MGVFKTQKIALSRIGGDFLAPPRDEEFARRYGLVFDGELPLYFAKIPVSLVRPFAPEFRPSEDPDGSRMVAQLAASIQAALSQQERTPSVWVYPSSDCYVMSDDYKSFAAYATLGVDLIPCMVMGEPTVPGPVEMMGPAPRDAVDRLTGRK